MAYRVHTALRALLVVVQSQSNYLLLTPCKVTVSYYISNCKQHIKQGNDQ